MRADPGMYRMPFGRKSVTFTLEAEMLTGTDARSLKHAMSPVA